MLSPSDGRKTPKSDKNPIAFFCSLFLIGSIAGSALGLDLHPALEPATYDPIRAVHCLGPLPGLPQMADLEKAKGKCPCGEALPEPLPYW
jgi:hypothetical protein